MTVIETDPVVSVLKDFIQHWGGKLIHQTLFFQKTVFHVHLITRIQHDRDECSMIFSQLDSTDGWTDWEVTGSTAALLHTGESFEWRLFSKISPVHPL